MHLRQIAVAGCIALALGGCSTMSDMGGWVSGWFEPSVPRAKPAELTEFKASATLTRLWDANVGAGGGFAFAPASDGKSIFAAGRDGRIVKLDPASGREVARADAGKALSTGVRLGNGLVLVGTLKGEVLAYRAADLQPAWTAKLAGEILTVPVAEGAVVAVRSNNGSTYLLEAETGKTRWTYSRSQPALTLREAGALGLDGSALYVGHSGGKLTALSLANGGPLWEVNVALPRGATELERIADVVSPMVLDERVVCAAAYQGRVACFDRRNGQTVWGRELSSMSGVAMDAGFLYVADDHGAVYAFDKERGVNLWKQDKLRDRRVSAPLGLGSRLAVGDLQGYVHLINRDDGAFAARAATDGSAIRAPMLALEQGLVVQTSGGHLYAFKIQ